MPLNLRTSASLLRIAGLTLFMLFVLWSGGCGGSSPSAVPPPSNPVPSLASSSSNPSSPTAGGAAFTLTVTGSNFVSASTVEWNGSPRVTIYISSTSLQASITASDIASGGTASITVVNPPPGGGVSQALPYTINNPLPAIVSLSPSPAIAGSSAFTLTVTGSSFVPTSTVQWNGTPRGTTFVSSSSLQASIAAADVVSTGSAAITVVTPAPDGGTSNSLSLPINNGTPALVSLSPNSATVDAASSSLTISGSNFVSSSVVMWSGSPRPTTVVSNTSLQASIGAADLLTAGTALITVVNPAPGGGISNPLNFTVNNPLPVSTSINPTAVLAGTVAGFTLTMTGTNFVPSSVIQWNGSPRPTSFVSGTQLKASIPASDIAAPGAANITAFNPAPGGGTSPALSLLICAVSLKSVSAIATPNYMAWDANRATLYVSVASTDPSIPNTIIPVNPLTATAGTPVPAGNNPHLFSISSDDSYLWVGLDGDNAVQRFLLPALTKDISFKLPIDSANHAEQAVSLEASPFSPHVLAVGSGSWGDSPAAYGGIFIYDDATPRPTFIPGYGSGGPTTDWIQWGPNSSTIYGTSTGTVSTLNVTSSGISLASLNGGQGGPFRGVSHYDRGNGNLYSFGYAYNPANGSLLGKFTVPDERECVSDSTLGRFFCIRSTADPVQVELWVFDLNTYALLARYYLGAPLGQPPAPITGAPFQVLRWGKAGLAVATSTFPYAGNGGLFLLDGLGINPAVPPDFSAVAVASTSYPTVTSLTPSQTTIGSTDVTVTLSGTNFTPDTTVCFVCFLGSNQNFQTTFVNSQQLTFTIPAANLSTAGFLTIGVDDSATNTYGANSLTFAINPQSGGSASTNVTAVQLAGLSVAYDPHSALLYVATADYEPLYPNSIVAIDPTTGSASKTQTVGSNPDLLSVSANGQFLYMGFASSTSMAQLPLPLPSTELTWALHNPATSAVYWAGNLEAAPQSPHTTALNLLDIQLTPANLGGVVIYDDKALLPNYVQGWGSSTLIFDGLAWGSSDQVLTGASATSPLSELQVNSSGVSVLATGTTDFNSTPGAIHSDFGTGLIYSDSGKVADPATQAVVGNYNASGLLAPDSSLNRVFILGQTSTQQGTNNFTIQSFDQKNYTPVSSLTIDNVLGIPTQLIRCGTSCLALLTNNQGNYGGTQGMVYLIQDSTFVSSKLAAPAAATATSTEFVKLRWKPLTTSDIIKTLRARNQQHPN